MTFVVMTGWFALALFIAAPFADAAARFLGGDS